MHPVDNPLLRGIGCWRGKSSVQHHAPVAKGGWLLEREEHRTEEISNFGLENVVCSAVVGQC
jgi:hypothetical protein